MSDDAEDPIPYPLPANWDERGMGAVSPVAAVFMALTAAALLVLGATCAVRGDVLWTVFWAVSFGALMAGLSVSREGPPRRYRGPVLMNAVALTRADQEPPIRGCTSSASSSRPGGSAGRCCWAGRDRAHCSWWPEPASSSGVPGPGCC